MSGYKRKIFFIYPDFQLRFIAWLLIPALANAAVLITSLYLIVNRSKEISTTIGLNSDHLFFAFIDMQREYMFWVYLFTTVMLSVLLIVFGLFLSHRLAGPMVKLRNHITNINSGSEVEHVFLRKNDFFRELLPPLNEHLDQYKEVTESSDKK
jgi:hypothetical protein